MIYLSCGREVLDVIAAMMKLHHKELADMNVTVSASYCFDGRNDETGEPEGRALECKGVAAAAVVRGTKLKERVQGRADVEILVCGVTWPELTPKQQDALIDHELEHVELVIDRETYEPKLDDHGRPIINIKDHDLDFGWFLVIAERHGEHSPEVRQARMLLASYGEILMMDGPAGNTGKEKQFQAALKRIKALERDNEKKERELEALRAIIQIHDEAKRKKSTPKRTTKKK